MCRESLEPMVTVCFRTTPKQKAKLEWLAERTGRQLSQVLRVLVEQAELGQYPDICLGRPSMQANGDHIELEAT